MDKLFASHIEAILDDRRPKDILEVGVFEGATTIKLLEWASAHGARVSSLDPAPWEGSLPDDVKKGYKDYRFYRNSRKEQQAIRPRFIEEVYARGLDKNWACHKITSLDFLDQHTRQKFDAYFLDGDHNYYTVYHELEKILPAMKVGDVVFLHDVGVKWGRRDGFYDIQSIPAEFRNRSRQGVISAVEDVLRKYNGYKKGYLCAVEHMQYYVQEGVRRKGLLRLLKAVLKVLFRKNMNSFYDTEYHRETERQFGTGRKGSFFDPAGKHYQFEILTREHHGLGVITRTD